MALEAVKIFPGVFHLSINHNTVQSICLHHCDEDDDYEEYQFLGYLNLTDHFTVRPAAVDCREKSKWCHQYSNGEIITGETCQEIFWLNKR